MVQLLIELFGKPRVNADLKNGLLELFAQYGNESRFFDVDEHFSAQAFQRVQVGVDKDDAESVRIVQIADDVGEFGFRKDRQDGDFPGLDK